MTIQEAIKSGKPFKRDGMRFYLSLDYETGYICEHDSRHTNARDTDFVTLFLVDDLLADDWVLQEDGE